jgi:hypothetical protein
MSMAKRSSVTHPLVVVGVIKANTSLKGRRGGGGHGWRCFKLFFEILKHLQL